MASTNKNTKKPHPLQWVVEPIMDEASYIQKSMFGCQACYLKGRLVLALTSGEEPWNGLLIPTDHQFHGSIRKEFKSVEQHPVLKKWLYLPEASEDFEAAASDIVEAIRLNDQRFGVEPKERKRKKHENR
ncbi:MAG: hypothetical protein FIA94_08415 [Nitrospirae bacterium]|nr:hypothetical protein [Nitrospirota bacterium]